MAATVIKVPSLPAGLTMTCDVRHITSLAVLETVTLTESSGVYSGTVSTATAGQCLFDLKASGIIIEHRVRTIADTIGPFVILSELEFSPGDGGGLNLVTITIDDGTDPLEGALVRVTNVSTRVTVATDASGIAVFKLDDGTYDVIVSLGGYGVLAETLVVSGTTTDGWSLDPIVVVPPASALVSTGVLLCYDEEGILEEDVSISCQMTIGPGTPGYALDTKVRTVVSDVDGVCEFTGMIRGATYRFWRGTATASTPSSGLNVLNNITKNTVLVPNADSFSIPEILGSDAVA